MAKKNLIKDFFIKNNIKSVDFIFLFIAGIINAIGVGMFLSANNLLDGGLSGTSIALSMITPVSASIFLIVLNFPFYILAYKRIGLKTLIYSLFTISIYAFSLYLINKFVDLESKPIVQETILAAVFGGLLSGIGSGITIRLGGALDGIEVCSLLFSKKLGVTVGQFVMAYNVILFVTFGFLKGFDYPLYSIIAYYVGLKVIDAINEGLDKTKMFLIISDKQEEVAEAINEQMQRQMTLIESMGYYTKEKKQMIYCVCNRFEVNRLKMVIENVDPGAFITISEVSEVVGRKIKKAKK